MFSQVPIFSDVCRYFAFPVLKQASTNKVTISTAYGTNFGNVALMPDQYFMLTNFRCFTNYDNYGGIYTSAVVTAAMTPSPVVVPNAFTVQIQRGQNNLFSNNPMTQAQICSSGYLAGKSLPIPTIYGPRENFGFTFTDTTGLTKLTDAEVQINLEIQMFMEGYLIPIGEWSRFLNYFPDVRVAYGP